MFFLAYGPQPGGPTFKLCLSLIRTSSATVSVGDAWSPRTLPVPLPDAGVRNPAERCDGGVASTG